MFKRIFVNILSYLFWSLFFFIPGAKLRSFIDFKDKHASYLEVVSEREIFLCQISTSFDRALNHINVIKL